MLLERTNAKLRNIYIVEDTGKKVTKSWLLNSEKKLIQTALRRTAYSATKNPEENTIRKTLILYKKAKYMHSEFD